MAFVENSGTQAASYEMLLYVGRQHLVYIKQRHFFNIIRLHPVSMPISLRTIIIREISEDIRAGCIQNTGFICASWSQFVPSVY